MRLRLLKRLLQRDLAAMLPHAAPDIQFDFTASDAINDPAGVEFEDVDPGRALQTWCVGT
jgi:hypothetical protein